MKWPVRTSISIVVFLSAWEGIARAGLVPIALFPPPSRVFGAFWEMVRTGELARDVRISLGRVAAGFAAGTTVGVAVGVTTGRISWADQYLSPLINLFRPIPPVAAIPLLITWFGITEFSKVFSIALAVFLIVWVNAHEGAREIPRTFLWSARTLRARGPILLGRVILPGALPVILVGCRNGIAIAFVMVFVSELAGASSGLGYQISVSHLAYRMDRMIAALAVLGICGAVFDRILTLAFRATFPWLRFTTFR